MRGSGRIRVLVCVAAASVAVLGLAGCGRLGAGAPDGPVDTTSLSWEAQALESIGFNAADLVPTAAVATSPAPAASPGKDKPRRAGKFRRLRFAFSHNVLHGEAVVQTEEGTKTVVVQRGIVTAIDATSVTVKCEDGFTLTWKISDQIRVFERRTSVQPSAVAVGTRIGIAGAKDGDTTVARLIVIPGTKQ